MAFDLGLSIQAAREISAYATIRYFDWAAWAPHCGMDPNVYAWKPIIMWTMARENPRTVLFWNDCTNVFKSSTFASVESAVARHGIMLMDSGFGSHRKNVSPKTVDTLLRSPYNMDPLKMESTLDMRLLSSACVAFDVSHSLIRRILTEWLQYAVQVSLIAPEGSSWATHKYDMAGLSLFVSNHLGGVSDDVVVSAPVALNRNVDEPTILGMFAEALQETMHDGSLALCLMGSFAFAGFLMLLRTPIRSAATKSN